MPHGGLRGDRALPAPLGPTALQWPPAQVQRPLFGPGVRLTPGLGAEPVGDVSGAPKGASGAAECKAEACGLEGFRDASADLATGTGLLW